MRTSLWLVLLLGAFVACEDNSMKPQAFDRLRIVATLQGQELPFNVQMTKEQASLINGKEKARIGQVQIAGKAVSIVFPAFNSRIEFDRSTKIGTLTLTKAEGKKQSMPIAVQYDQQHRFTKSTASTKHSVSGTWAVKFKTKEGEETRAVALFEQSGANVTGTFMTALGDYRFLAGELNDQDLSLSCFDGGHAFLFKAKLDKPGKLIEGHFWSGTQWHESWTADLDEQAKLPDPLTLTTMKQSLPNWIFPNLSGQKVSLHDERYKGKVLLITIIGSWCPNCHDEAAFLSPLYKELKGRGLEIVGLLFEHSREHSVAARQGLAFKKKFAIDYELLIAGISNKKAASKALPELGGVLSYPSTLFVDRKGRVRKIHTGFSGPATGSAYELLQSQFKSTLSKLLAESP